MRQSTRAQIQIAETVAVIIIFIILATMSLLWFTNIGKTGQEKAIDTNTRLELLEFTKQVMNLPEIQCSIAGKIDTTCLDMYRIMSFTELSADPAFDQIYRDRFFGYKLEVVVIYPSTTTNALPIFDYPPADYVNTDASAIPVVLFDPITEKKHFSMLILTQYSGGTI